MEPRTGLLILEKHISKEALKKKMIEVDDFEKVVYSSPKQDQWNSDHLQWLTKWLEGRIMKLKRSI